MFGWVEFLLVFDAGIAQQVLVRCQQFLAGQTQVEWHVSNSTTSYELAHSSLKDQLFDHQSSGVTSSQWKDLNEQGPVDPTSTIIHLYYLASSTRKPVGIL